MANFASKTALRAGGVQGDTSSDGFYVYKYYSATSKIVLPIANFDAGAPADVDTKLTNLANLDVASGAQKAGDATKLELTQVGGGLIEIDVSWLQSAADGTTSFEVRPDSVDFTPPLGNDGDAYVISYQDGTTDYLKQETGAWVKKEPVTPSITTATHYAPPPRGDAIQGVQPTVGEVATPGEGDTVVVLLSDQTQERWLYTAGAWVLRQTIGGAPPSELVLSTTDLTGAANAGEEFGLNTVTGQEFFVDGGNWQPSPSTKPLSTVNAYDEADQNDTAIGGSTDWGYAAGTEEVTGSDLSFANGRLTALNDTVVYVTASAGFQNMGTVTAGTALSMTLHQANDNQLKVLSAITVRHVGGQAVGSDPTFHGVTSMNAGEYIKVATSSSVSVRINNRNLSAFTLQEYSPPVGSPAIDAAPSLGSTNTVESQGIKTALDLKADQTALALHELLANKATTIRATPTADDTAYPSEKAVRDALDALDVLNFTGVYKGSAATAAALPAGVNGDWAILTVDDGANQAGLWVTDGATYTLAKEIPDLLVLTQAQITSTTGAPYTEAGLATAERLDQWGTSRRVRRVFNSNAPFDFSALGYVDRTAVYIRNTDPVNGITITYGAGGAVTREITYADGSSETVAAEDSFGIQPSEIVVMEKDGATVYASVIPAERIKYFASYAAANSIGGVPWDGIAVIRDVEEIWIRKTTTNSADFPADGAPTADWVKASGEAGLEIVRYTADGPIQDKDHRAIFEAGAVNMTLPVSTQDRLIQIISEGPATVITANGSEQFTGPAGTTTDSTLNVNETFQWATLLGRGAAAGWSQYVGQVATAQSVGSMVDFSESPGPGDAASFSLALTNSGANLRHIISLTCSNGTNFSPPLDTDDGVNRWWYDFDHTTGTVNIRRFGAFSGGSVRGVALYS